MPLTCFNRSRVEIVLTVVVVAVLTLWTPSAGRRALALGEEKALSRYAVRVWQTREGLPQNTIQAIVQTREGYIWLGTLEGLVRFDGVRFRTFDRRNTARMPSNVVRALLEGRRGELWIGTNAGLLRLLDGQFTTYTTRDGLGHDLVNALCETEDGSVWVGTAGGIDRLREGEFTHYSARDGLPGEVVTALHAGRDGSVWVGTTTGLGRLRDGRFETYTTAQGLTHDRVQALCGDGAGGVWVGTEGGLNHLRDGKLTTYTKRVGLPDNDIHALYRDREGSVWVGTTSSGLGRLRDGVFNVLTHRDGLSHDYVWSVCEDREGGLWVGTSNGLNRLAASTFTSYAAARGLPAEGVWAVFEDRSGTVWVGSDGGGLSRLEGENFVSFPARGGLLGGGVLSLYEDAAGDLWVGALGALVRIRRGQVLEVYTARDGLGGNSVRAIVGDKGGLWVGTNEGLNRLENGRLRRFTTRDGLSDDSIRALHVDRAGDLWVGTVGGGLDRLRDGEFTRHTTAEGMPSNGIRSIHEDGDGVLWVGTDGGLARLCGARLTAYTTAAGMFDDTVMGLVEDDDGNFWMGSNKGIFRTSRRGLEEFAAGRTSQIVGQAFDLTDGMPSAECNGISQPSAAKTRDGRLWFPTVAGLAVVDPRQSWTNPVPPPVVVEELLVDDKAVGHVAGGGAARIGVEPGARRVEFHYTGLSFVAPERVRFRYRLEGFDQDWVEAGTRRAAYYTNLTPGRYRFRVAAANADGVWNAEGESVEFEVRPFFFQTGWFYALAAAAALALVWGLYLLRVRRIRSQFVLVLAERTRLARELHDTLIQGVIGASTVLEAVSGMLPQTAAPASGYLEQARHQLRQSLDDARRAVWELRDPAGQAGDLPAALRGMAETLRAGTSAEIEVEQTGRARRLDGAPAECLLRIAREAVTNAAAHAGARRIRVRLSFDARSVRLSVGDDGRGFDASLPPAPDGDERHFGLVGMRERAEACGGRLSVESAPGKGTTITATLPAEYERARGGGLDGR